MEPAQKVIFLDIDGVMNNRRTLQDHKQKFHRGELPGETDDLAGISPRMVGLLVELIRATGARLVLSSSWRCNDVWSGGLNGPEETLRRLRANGLPEDIDFLDVTLDFETITSEQQSNLRERFQEFKFTDVRVRQMEIREWLRLHPETERFVILDDLSGWSILRPHVVQTNFLHGFTRKHLKKALRILNE